MPNLQPRARHVATPILSSALPSGLRTLQPAAPTAHTPARSTRIAQPLQYSSLALINALPSQRRIVAASLACYLAHAVRNPTHPTIRRGFASVLRLPVALSLSPRLCLSSKHLDSAAPRPAPRVVSRFSCVVRRASPPIYPGAARPDGVFERTRAGGPAHLPHPHAQHSAFPADNNDGRAVARPRRSPFLSTRV